MVTTPVLGPITITTVSTGGGTLGSTMPVDSLRPGLLDAFVGQTKLKKVLEIAINGARSRHEPMGHILFDGPPGLGKTTLAGIIAQEMGAKLIVSSATSVTKVPSMATLLNQLEEGTVLFIDEVHRLPRVVEEAFYSVMEDYRLDITTDKLHLNMRVPKFTLVGATTRKGMLTKPMQDRFIGHYHLEWYSLDELAAIVKRSARILHLTIEDKAAEEIATRCKRTPRIANGYLLQARDFANSYGIVGQVNHAVVLGMMETLEIDGMGLAPADRTILETIIKRFRGGPVGLGTLAAILVEEEDVLARIHEPYLMQCGFIERTPRGRVATNEAYTHMKIKLPPRPRDYSEEMTDE